MVRVGASPSGSPVATQRPPSNGAYYTASVLYNAGFRGWPLVVMTAISGRESSWNPIVINNNPSTGDYSVGLFQLNYFGSLAPGRTAAWGTPSYLQSNPQAQANAAYQLAGGNSLSGLSNWNLSASPANGQTPTPLSNPGTYTIVPYLAQALAAAQAVGTFGPATAASTSAGGWPKGGGPSVVAGGYQSATLTSAQLQNGPPDCNTKGPNHDGIVVKIGGSIPVVGSLGPSITYCQLKAWTGAGLLVAGGILALAGIGVIVVSTFGAKASGPLGKVATGVIGGIAGERMGERVSSSRRRTIPKSNRSVTMDEVAAEDQRARAERREPFTEANETRAA